MPPKRSARGEAREPSPAPKRPRGRPRKTTSSSNLQQIDLEGVEDPHRHKGSNVAVVIPRMHTTEPAMTSNKVAKEPVAAETKNPRLSGKESLHSKGHQSTMAKGLPKVSSTAGPLKPQKLSNVSTQQVSKPTTTAKTAKESAKKPSTEKSGDAKSSSKASSAVREESSTLKAKPTVSDKPAGKAPKVKTIAATPLPARFKFHPNDNSDGILMKALDNMSPDFFCSILEKLCSGSNPLAKVLKKLFKVPKKKTENWKDRVVERLTDEKNGASDGLKQELLVRKEDVVIWEDGDDKNRYSRKKVDKSSNHGDAAKSGAASCSTADGKSFTARFSSCHKCQEFYDVTKNDVGMCKYHPGHLETSKEWEREWNRQFRQRQRMSGSSRTTGRDMDDYDRDWFDAPKVWYCCKKPEKEKYCMIGRHQSKESYERASSAMKDKKGRIGEPEVVDPCEMFEDEDSDDEDDEDEDDPYGMGYY